MSQAAGVLRVLRKCRVTIPELNPEMDVFRVGTLLEMVREMALGLAQDGQRVKVSVQQAMGQGVFQVCNTFPSLPLVTLRHASMQSHIHHYTNSTCSGVRGLPWIC